MRLLRPLLVVFLLVGMIYSVTDAAHARARHHLRPCRNGYVALTFDDGPSITTPAILRALRGAGQTKATFFNTGAHEQAHPGLVSREAAAGMWFGNHSYSHPFMDELDDQAVYNEMLGTNQIHAQITGSAPTLYRSPFGRVSNVQERFAHDLGMTPVLWTRDTHDYDGVTTGHIVRVALSAHDGDIVLMHDAGYDTTVRAIPRIVQGLADRGLCAGKIHPTTTPVTAWPGTVFYARAGRW